MRTQLAVFSIFLLLLYLDWLVVEMLALRGPRRGYAPRPPMGGGVTGRRAGAPFRDALWSYAPFAAWAVMMFSFGKPDLLPQWVGWGVVGCQILRTGSLMLDWPRLKAFFGVLVFAELAYLWMLHLPFFQKPLY